MKKTASTLILIFFSAFTITRAQPNSYSPSSNIKMGDYLVIWTNEHVKARNIYIFMGHSPDLFDNEAYKKIFTNAISWAVINKGN
jgi:type 1 glutamine amidotransferase